LTARAWLWTNDACDYPQFERRGRGQCMWLKDAITEAVRLPNSVRCIEYEAANGTRTRFLYWASIVQIWNEVICK
jgi:hypothetical protein